MRRKMLSAFLALCMGVSLFAGCGGKESSSSAESSSAESIQSSSDTDSGASSEESSSSGTETTPAESSSETGNELWADYKADLTKNLSNPNATDKANAIYNWLCSIKGKYIISGQQEKCSDSDNAEFTYIKSICGELPALRGLDFINGDYKGVVRRSKTWDKFNALISICWHMGEPGKPDAGYNSSKARYKGLKDAMNNPDSDAYKQIVEDIDKAVPALKELQDAGIVVLWRPFHEFDGGWFWWGMSGGEAFVKLWRLMYDRYTNVHGLNNLIWVLGYSHSKTGNTDWYPGDEYVDIIGADVYDPAANAAGGYQGLYQRLEKGFPDTKKPFALHECGRIPDTAGLQTNKAEWLWYLVWHSDFLRNDKYNTESSITLSYTSDYVLTMSEMPDFHELVK